MKNLSTEGQDTENISSFDESNKIKSNQFFQPIFKHQVQVDCTAPATFIISLDNFTKLCQLHDNSGVNDITVYYEGHTLTLSYLRYIMSRMSDALYIQGLISYRWRYPNA